MADSVNLRRGIESEFSAVLIVECVEETGFQPGLFVSTLASGKSHREFRTPGGLAGNSHFAAMGLDHRFYQA